MSNFSGLALTRIEMKNVKGGTNYDCYCSGGGAFGFTSSGDQQMASAKARSLSSQVCGSGAAVSCGIVTTKKKK